MTRLFLAMGFLLTLTPSAMAAHPAFNKVIMIVLENTSYKEALKLPYFSELTKQGALFTNFYAEAHPSQPNYIAMISGSTLGVKNDSPVNFADDADHLNLADLLEQKGLSWKAYAEDYPGNCYLGKTYARYARKHVPFLSFTSIQNNPARCARVVNASELDQDIAQNTLPNFSFYVPNLDNDGHDTGAVFADQWLSKTFGARFADPNFTKDTLIVITFDESDALFGLGNNKIYTVVLGANVIPGSVVSTPASHYSILKTIEDTFGLGNLCRGDASAAGIYDIWN